MEEEKVMSNEIAGQYPDSPRKEFLQRVAQLVCQDRNRQYGDPEDNFRNIAAIWNVVLVPKLKEPLGAQDVAVAMVGLKLGRYPSNPRHLDNLLDGAGYLACLYDLIVNSDAPAVEPPKSAPSCEGGVPNVMMACGDRVRKIGGSFQHTGVVVGVISTSRRETRIVMEFDDPVGGMLHIYRPDQVERIDP